MIGRLLYDDSWLESELRFGLEVIEALFYAKYGIDKSRAP